MGGACGESQLFKRKKDSRSKCGNVWIEKDPVHKFIVTATLDSEYEIEIDRIEIYGDEIDEGADIETVVAEKIDERDEERASMDDWNRHYGSYMGLSEDPDWFDSYAPD